MAERKRKSRDVVFVEPVLDEQIEDTSLDTPSVRNRKSKEKKPANFNAGSFRSAMGASFDKAKPILWFYTAYAVITFILGVLLSLSITSPAFFGINQTMASLYSVFSNVNMFGLVLGGVAAILLFGKYKKKNANDVFHSVATTEKHLYWSDYITGLITFLIPMAIGYIAQSLTSMSIESQNPGAGVFETFGVDYTLLLNFVFSYSIAVLALSLTNSVIEGLIGYAALCALPIIVNTFLDFANSAVLGQNQVLDVVPKIKFQTTITLIIELFLGNSEGKVESYGSLWLLCIVVVAVSALFAFLGFVAFIKLRTHDSLDSKSKDVISTCVVTFFSFYAGFMVLFFKRSQRSTTNMIALTLTMVALGFVVQFLVNTMLYRTFRFKISKMTSFLAGVVVLVGLSAYYFTGGFGVMSYVPKTADIESITFNYTNSVYEEEVNRARRDAFTHGKYLAHASITVEYPITYTDENIIETLTDYHKSLLKHYKRVKYVEEDFQNNSNFGKGETPLEITYNLKNGDTVTRYYNYYGTIEEIEALDVIDPAANSVKTGKSRVLAYINGDGKDDIEHTFYIYPSIPDGNNMKKYTFTDEQIRGLIGAVRADEKNVSADEIRASEGGDLCMFYIVPHESMKSEFMDMTIYSGDVPGMLLVKGCYKNTISYLENTLGLGRFLKKQRYKNTDQIIYGSSDAFGIHSWWGYEYELGDRFNYNNSYVNAMYLDTALEDIGEDPYFYDTYDKKAINYLKDHAKLSCSDPADGVMFMLPDTMDIDMIEGLDNMVFGDKRLYYVTQEEWDTFISMTER